MNNLAVIPARGGSKRIPKKNIKTFSGKPLISYSIVAALKSKLFKQVVISTDSDEISDVAIEYGGTVPFLRDKNLADDLTGTSEVVKDAINQLKKENMYPSYVCCIYATAPLLSAESLLRGYKELKNNKNKLFALSVTKYRFPIQRSLKISDSGGISPLFPEYITSRSQDLEETFHDAGQFYWGTTEAWLESKEIFADHSIPIVIPHYKAQDIDTPEDWHHAELMHRAIKQMNDGN